MANKYTRIGIYKRPSAEQMERAKETGQTQRCYIKVYTGKDNLPVTLKNGDTLSFTKAEDKIKEIQDAVKAGKMKEDTANYFIEQFSHPDSIAEVTVVQK